MGSAMKRLTILGLEGVVMFGGLLIVLLTSAFG